MIEPEALVNLLQSRLHAVTSTYQQIGEPGEKLYEYHLEFDDYKTVPLLREQISTTKDESDVDLLLQRIEPVVRTTESSIEARLEVTITETQNRNALEHRSIDDFSE